MIKQSQQYYYKILLMISYCLRLLGSTEVSLVEKKLPQLTSSKSSEEWLVIEKITEENDEKKEEVVALHQKLEYPSPLDESHTVKPYHDRVGWILKNSSYRSLFLTETSLVTQAFEHYIQENTLDQSDQLMIYIETFVYDTDKKPLKPIVYLIYFNTTKKETKKIHFLSSTYYYSGDIVIQKVKPGNQKSLYQIKTENHYHFFEDTPLFGSLTELNKQKMTSLIGKVNSIIKLNKKRWLTHSNSKKVQLKVSASNNKFKDSFVLVTYLLGDLFAETSLTKPLPELFLKNNLCLNNKSLLAKIKPGLTALANYQDSYFTNWQKELWTDIVTIELVEKQNSKASQEKKKFSGEELLANVGYSVKGKNRISCPIM